MKEMSKMHEEDAHDDNLIAMETSNQIHTRAQMRAAENAAHSHILEPPAVDTDINLPSLVRNVNPTVTATNERNNVNILPSILPSRATGPLLQMIQPPFNNLMKPASIYTLTFLITPNSRSQKHLHVILSR